MFIAVAHFISAPPLPKLPPQYEVFLEANFHITTSTFDIKEYVDTINNRGAVHTEGNGVKTKVTYNYKTNELFNVVTQNLGKYIRY